MNKITIKQLVEFRSKSDRSKSTFAKNLGKESRRSEGSGGGDYWISCLSAIRNTFKYDNEDAISEKIDLLHDKIAASNIDKVRLQFQRNIDILENFRNFNFSKLKPNNEINFLKQHKTDKLINIKTLPVEANPCYIYTFLENDLTKVGGIWFLAKLDGFKKSEMGLFIDIMHRYLNSTQLEESPISSDYCIAVDVTKVQAVSFADLESKKIPSLLNTTISDLLNYIS